MVLCPEPPSKLKIPGSKITELTDDANHDSPKIERRTRGHHIERHKSCVVTLSDMELNDFQPRRLLQTLETSKSPGGGSQCSLHEETPTDTNALHRHAIADAAWEALKRSIVYFRGQPIGTVAALDKSQVAALNYDQVFMRDFIPSALAFLMKGEHLIVKNFLVEAARLQSREKMVDLFGQGVMPASFKAYHRNPTQKTESLLADFGETSIGRVAPVDSGLWWIILLRAYTKWTGDNSLAESPNCQRAMHLILRLCLSEGCDTSPALLCANGCSMIDRRMGIYGYPIEIQALFFMAMRCALSMLKQDSDAGFVNHITKRIQALSYHLHSYRLDFQRLYDIYHYKTEEYSQTALNEFNVIPQSIPGWIFDFMPSRGGYFIGNVSPARMDFRWFCLGNFIAILSSLTTGEQAEAILDLVEERWEELVGEMPLKICYPAMENQEWQIVTGCDPKNTRWSYHNGGSWPGLQCWTNMSPHLTRRAMELMERQLAKLCNRDPCTSVLLCAGGRSVHDIISVPAWLCAEKLSKVEPIMDKDFIVEGGFGNTALISLDGLAKFIGTYLTGIGRLRWWCEIYGWRVDLSYLFKTKMAIFSTPPGGTFNFIIEYDRRTIGLSLYGRNLYTMGIRVPHGTFEIKGPTERRKNYMSGESVKILPFQKNYRFLASRSDVRNVRLGLYSFREAFNVLYKCRGETDAVREAVATFAVHLSEAGRLQKTMKDVCAISLDHSMEKLDSRSSDNSFWIENYGDCGRQELERINSMIDGEAPPAITHVKRPVTELEILKEIRIFPRDVYNEGNFEHEPAPPEATEKDGVLDAYHSWLRENKKSKSRFWSENDKIVKVTHFEEVPPPSATFPPYLIEDWCPEKEKGEEGEGEGGADGEVGAAEGGGAEGGGGEGEEEVKRKREDHISAIDTEKSFEGFLNHFPAVRRLMDLNMERQNQPKVPLKLTERMTCHLIRTALPAGQADMGVKESIYKYARMKTVMDSQLDRLPITKTEFGMGRNQLKPIFPIGRNFLMRAGHSIIRSFRFL